MCNSLPPPPPTSYVSPQDGGLGLGRLGSLAGRPGHLASGHCHPGPYRPCVHCLGLRLPLPSLPWPCFTLTLCLSAPPTPTLTRPFSYVRTDRGKPCLHANKLADLSYCIGGKNWVSGSFSHNNSKNQAWALSVRFLFVCCLDFSYPSCFLLSTLCLVHASFVSSRGNVVLDYGTIFSLKLLSYKCLHYVTMKR